MTSCSSLNRDLLDRKKQSSQIEGVIESYELAFRMQSAVPELMDANDENESTLEQYGINNRATENFGRQCLMARRFAEAGVRFIEITHGNWGISIGISTRPSLETAPPPTNHSPRY